MALKDGLDWGMRKWAKAFRGEGTAGKTDCSGVKGPEKSEIRSEAPRLRLRRFPLDTVGNPKFRIRA